MALGYDPEADWAPKVLAKGRGAVAEKILMLAREQGIPIQRDSDLAQALAALELGEEIPEELYRAVAEVLAFIYRMNGLYAGREGEV